MTACHSLADQSLLVQGKQAGEQLELVEKLVLFLSVD